MKLNHALLSLAAAGMLSTQTYASEAPVEAAAQPIAAFTAIDTQALFEASDKPMQLAALSEQEMKETDGAVLPVLVTTGLYTTGGAIVGGVAHVWRTGGTTDIWRSIGAGATGGFYASPLVRGVFGTYNFARFTAGTFGASSWYRY